MPRWPRRQQGAWGWLPIARQDRKHLLWLSLDESIPSPHTGGKVAVVGHTVQRSGNILDLPHLKCIDTGCGHGGLLTALELTTGQLWQVNENGVVVRITR